MRFKSKLAPEHVSMLHSLVGPFSKLAGKSAVGDGRSVLLLDDTHLRLCCKGKSQDSDGVECYGEFKAGGGLFLEHRIESAAENNVILMELDLAQLKVALHSLCSNDRWRNEGFDRSNNCMMPPEDLFTILKLAKRNNIPCLCLEASTIAANSAARIQVSHAIPVRILRSSEQQYYLPPHISRPDVQLQMSPSKPLRNVIEKMRTMKSNKAQQTIYLQGNARTGELTVSLDSDGASIRTYFGRLTPVELPAAEDENVEPKDDACTVKVDAKKLCAALQWQQQTHLASSVMLCIIENERFVLHVSLNPASVGFFTYYVPVQYLSSDPQDE